MNRSKHTLDEYFSELEHEEVVTDADLRRIVERRAIEDVDLHDRPHKRRWIMIAVLALIVATGTIWTLSTTEAPRSTPARTSGASATAWTGPPAEAPRATASTDSASHASSAPVASPNTPETMPPAVTAIGTKRTDSSLEDITGMPEVRRRKSRVTRPSRTVVPAPASGLVELTEEELAAMGVWVNERRMVEYYYKYRTLRPGMKSSQPIDPRNGPSNDDTAWTWSTDPAIGKAYKGAVAEDTVRIYMGTAVDRSLPLTYPSYAPEFVTDMQGNRIPFDHILDPIKSNSSATRQERTPEEKRADSIYRARHDSIINSLKATSTTRTFDSHKEVSKYMDSLVGNQAKDPLYVSRLIPIHVNTRGGRDVILWYFPHARTMADLPRRVQLALRDEVAQMESNVTATDSAMLRYRRWLATTRRQLDSILAIGGNRAGNVQDDANTGGCYLSFCAVSSGAVSESSLAPNPTRGMINVQYRLSGPRAITITLHDLKGTAVRTLSPTQTREAGVRQQSISLADISPGVYMLAITTERGERAMQRVVVE